MNRGPQGRMSYYKLMDQRIMYLRIAFRSSQYGDPCKTHQKLPLFITHVFTCTWATIQVWGSDSSQVLAVQSCHVSLSYWAQAVRPGGKHILPAHLTSPESDNSLPGSVAWSLTCALLLRLCAESLLPRNHFLLLFPKTLLSRGVLSYSREASGSMLLKTSGKLCLPRSVMMTV